MAENLPDLQKSINLKQDKHKKYHINARLANCCNPMIKDQFLKAAREKKSICREKKKKELVQTTFQKDVSLWTIK